MLKRGDNMDYTDWCKYLFKEQDGTFTCEIHEAIENKDEEFFKIIPPSDFEYWVDNCKEYPKYNEMVFVEGCVFG